MKRAFVSGLLVITCGLAACGENPTSPTNPAPFAAQFAGSWAGTTVRRSVTSGECVGDDLRNAPAGSDVGTVTLTQSATDISAIIRSESTGLTCQYDGSASVNSFAASSVKCDADILFRCSNGQTRILRPVGSTLSATQNGFTAQGTVTTTYNVFFVDPVTNQEKPISGMTIESQFTAVRR